MAQSWPWGSQIAVKKNNNKNQPKSTSNHQHSSKTSHNNPQQAETTYSHPNPPTTSQNSASKSVNTNKGYCNKPLKVLKNLLKNYFSLIPVLEIAHIRG